MRHLGARAGLLPLGVIFLFVTLFFAHTDVIGIVKQAVVRFTYEGALHSHFAAGRLGNRVIQNVAVSMLARRYDVAAAYAMEHECRALGLELWSGSKRMTGPDMVLTNQLLRNLLDAADGAQLPGHLHLNGEESYFQFPWFAHIVRNYFRLEALDSLYRANPWRGRFNNNSDTFVHVRLGDIEHLPSRGAAAYAAAIGSPRGRVLIASDSPAHPTVRTLVQRFNAELVLLSPVETIQLGATCANLVLSDGTFSWVIGALAPASSVVRIVPRHNASWTGDMVFDGWTRF